MSGQPPQLIPSGCKSRISLQFENGNIVAFFSPLDYATALALTEKDEVVDFELRVNIGQHLDPTGKTVRKETLRINPKKAQTIVVTDINDSGIVLAR